MRVCACVDNARSAKNRRICEISLINQRKQNGEAKNSVTYGTLGRLASVGLQRDFKDELSDMWCGIQITAERVGSDCAFS